MKLQLMKPRRVGVMNVFYVIYQQLCALSVLPIKYKFYKMYAETRIEIKNFNFNNKTRFYEYFILN